MAFTQMFSERSASGAYRAVTQIVSQGMPAFNLASITDMDADDIGSQSSLDDNNIAQYLHWDDETYNQDDREEREVARVVWEPRNSSKLNAIGRSIK
jgi:hypothetical protein